MRRYLISAATTLGLLVGAGPAAALVFSLDFNAETAETSNPSLTGASGSANFSFSDVTGGVQLDLTVTNTTGLLPTGTFGTGATSSSLLAFYFDTVGDLQLTSSTLSGALDEIELGANFEPFSKRPEVGSFSIGICHALNTQDDCFGGQPGNGLSVGDSSAAELIFQTQSTAAVIASILMDAFETGDANAGLRFQQVNGTGADSEKLLYTGEVSTVPLPATLPLLLGAISVMGFTFMRKRSA